jgi:hypothetical protein
MARPKSRINLEELEKLCAMQCTEQEIAAYFRVSARTIERRRKIQSFRETIERGRAKGRVSVRRQLFRLCNDGNLQGSLYRRRLQSRSKAIGLLKWLKSPTADGVLRDRLHCIARFLIEVNVPCRGPTDVLPRGRSYFRARVEVERPRACSTCTATR